MAEAAKQNRKGFFGLVKNYLSMADLAMWVTLIAGKVVLCACILQRRFFRRLPWFTAYIFVTTIASLLLFGIAFLGSYPTYYYGFYLSGHLQSILIFATLIECGRQVLPGLKLPGREKALALLLSALAAVVIFAAYWPLNYLENRIEMAAYLAIGATFVVIALYARYLGLCWSRLLAGVTFTLGSFNLCEGATRAITGHYPAFAVPQIRELSEIANILAVIAWIIVILSPWGERDITMEELQQYSNIVDDIEANLRRFAAGGGK